MKDNRLEKEFDEYFEGVNISDDITADAKKSVKVKRITMPKFAKYLSIAASIVLVFAVSLTVMLKNDSNRVTDQEFSSGNSWGNEGSAPDSNLSGGSGSGGSSDIPNSSGGDSSTMPDPPGGGSSAGDTPSAGDAPSAGDSASGPAQQFEYYYDGDLDTKTVSVSSLSSLDPSLKFIEDNAGDEYCTAGYMDEKLALVKAEISLDGDETTVFIEFTDEKVIYGGLSSYYRGNVRYYGETKYYLSNRNGECKLTILYGEIKYYFRIVSSDNTAYTKYLNLIING